MRRRQRVRRRGRGGEDGVGVGVFGHLRLGLAAVAAILVIGTLGFMLIDRFSLLNALYRTVGLMTTSGGYEQITTSADKELTTFVVVLGIGALFYTLGAVAEYLIEGHLGRAIARRRMNRHIDRLSGHAIICGYGRVGRRIAHEFAAAGQPFVVIDMLEANVAKLEAANFLYLQGDATEDVMLLESGVQRAQSLLAATDADTENIAITLSARALAPALWIVARANREESEGKLVRAGADRVLSPYTLGGHRMAGLARQPHLMDFLDTAVKSSELDLALTVVQVEGGSPLVGMSLPASAAALPQNMRDATVIAVRAAGQGPWQAASRCEGKPVAVGDWLVVLGPVGQRQPGSVPEAITRRSRIEAVPKVPTPPGDGGGKSSPDASASRDTQ